MWEHEACPSIVYLLVCLILPRLPVVEHKRLVKFPLPDLIDNGLLDHRLSQLSDLLQGVIPLLSSLKIPMLRNKNTSNSTQIL